MIAEPAQQDVEQFSPMGGIIGRAEMRFRFLPEWGVIKTFAGVPAAIIATIRVGRHALERLSKPELEQDTRGIRGNLEAGADLPERGRLFEQLDVDTALSQRQHRGDAADPAAGDENFQPTHRRSPKTAF